MTPSERATWEKIRELASRFEKADRIVLGIPMWNFSFLCKLKQLIDLVCQRNMLFTFDGKEYRPALYIDKAFVAYVIGVHSITAMTVEHTWDGRALDMIDEGKKQAAELAKQF
jgi:FMN-dependent NADH-azoreductase